MYLDNLLEGGRLNQLTNYYLAPNRKGHNKGGYHFCKQYINCEGFLANGVCVLNKQYCDRKISKLLQLVMNIV